MGTHAVPVGGRLTGRGFTTMAGLAVLAALLIGWRLVAGLGAATGMNDGFPWGLWIAWDVVVGTALACGGYAMALLVYVMNRGRYHPLVRSALLTSALGYTMAGLSVAIDLGRWWNLWRIPLSPRRWNGESVLLEVALCVMLYTAVLWIEFAPALLTRWTRRAGDTRARRVAVAASTALERALPFVIALGVLLPTMHQSSLGSLLLLAGDKVHALWQSPMLPLFFLLTAIGVGFAAVVLESTIASLAFGRRLELAMLRGLARPSGLVLAAYAVLRVADAGWRGALPEVASPIGVVFLVEVALAGVASWLLLRPAPAGTRVQLVTLFRAAMLATFAVTLYRLSAYLVAFDPGNGWRYFPSVAELVITLGIMAGQVATYLYLVRAFPVLASSEPSAPVPAPPPGEPGVPSLVPPGRAPSGHAH